MNRRVDLFRRIALSLPGAAESSHMGHPDFRLNGRIFATLSAQEKDCGGVKLTPKQQQSFITEQPQAFSPVQGGWERMGMTFVHLKEADESLISDALQTAYHTLLQKKQSDKRSSRTVKPARPSH
jgi:YjbR